MRRALKASAKVVVAGVVLTALATAASFTYDSTMRSRDAQAHSLRRLAHFQDVIVDLGRRVDVARQFVDRGGLAWRSHDLAPFLAGFGPPPPAPSDWVVLSVAPGATAQSMLQAETGQADLHIQGETTGTVAAPVSFALADTNQGFLGANLAGLPAVARLLQSADADAKVAFAIVPVGQGPGPFKDGGVLISSFAANGPDKGQPRHLIARFVAPPEISQVLELSGAQDFLMTDAAGAAQLGQAALKADGNSLTLAGDKTAATGLQVWVAPAQGPGPRRWVAVAIFGLLATLGAALWRAGTILGARAQSTAVALEGTASRLAQVSASDDAFFSNSGTANCVVDMATQRFVRVNDRMSQLLGYSREELLATTFASLTHPEDVALSLERVGAAHATLGGFQQFEKRYIHKDGHIISCLVNTRRLAGGPGDAPLMATAIVDITEKKEQEKLRNALIKELAHRLRNSVQLMAIISRQTAKTAKTVAEHEAKFQQRLSALKVAHDLLFDHEWQAAPLDDIVRRILAPFRSGADAAALITIDVPALALPPQHAQTLALAFHELAMNSLEHGALGRGGGVAVLGTIEGSGAARQLHLKWVERASEAPAPAFKQGFGMRMLQTALPEQFGGTVELEWTPRGLIYQARLPLDSLTAAPAQG